MEEISKELAQILYQSATDVLKRDKQLLARVDYLGTISILWVDQEGIVKLGEDIGTIRSRMLDEDIGTIRSRMLDDAERAAESGWKKIK